MRIYNKRNFYIGLFWLVLGIAELCLFSYRGMTFIDVLACFCPLMIGISYTRRSLSRNLSTEDTDELSQYIIRKARSKAFSLSMGLCLLFMVFFLALASHTHAHIHVAMYIGFSAMFICMMVIEGIAEIYYNYKMK